MLLVVFEIYLYHYFDKTIGPFRSLSDLPIDEANSILDYIKTISFTYGDSMPTFSSKINDGKEYRKKLYTYDEILKIIDKYGLPQDWNDDGKYGPGRYIEAHIWSDETINKYR